MTRAALLVVGGGPAGLASARGYRAAGGRGRVVLAAAEGVAPYRRPPLSKDLLRGELEADALPLEAPGWYDEHDVELRAGAVVALDPAARRATLADGSALAFDALVLATGAEPARPPIAGAHGPRVLVLRTHADSDRLARRAAPGRRVAVVGTGFVGCEAAASLARTGHAVTLVGEEEAPQAARLGGEVAERLARWLERDGVELALGAPALALKPREDGVRVARDGASPVDADLVLLAVGVRPNVGLAAAVGLELAFEGTAVAVDERLRTSADGIWAAGDVAGALHPRAGRRLRVQHWGDALAQGEAAGRGAAGDADARWDAVPGFWSTVGERTLKQAAWQDGWSSVRLDEDADGFTAWYADAEERCVGVLTHGHDDDYAAGAELVAAAAAVPAHPGDAPR